MHTIRQPVIRGAYISVSDFDCSTDFNEYFHPKLKYRSISAQTSRKAPTEHPRSIPEGSWVMKGFS